MYTFFILIFHFLNNTLPFYHTSFFPNCGRYKYFSYDPCDWSVFLPVSSFNVSELSLSLYSLYPLLPWPPPHQSLFGQIHGRPTGLQSLIQEEELMGSGRQWNVGIPGILSKKWNQFGAIEIRESTKWRSKKIWCQTRGITLEEVDDDATTSTPSHRARNLLHILGFAFPFWYLHSATILYFLNI